MKYEYKEGCRLKVPAQVLGDELDRICEKNDGHLTAQAVVKASKPKKAPLHRLFEWDDTAAAQRYREEQARQAIRSVVVVQEFKKERKPVRAFVNVTRDEQKDYATLATAMSDEELRQQVLDRAWQELEAWRQRYMEFEELASIFRSMDKVRLKAA